MSDSTMLWSSCILTFLSLLVIVFLFLCATRDKRTISSTNKKFFKQKSKLGKKKKSTGSGDKPNENKENCKVALEDDVIKKSLYKSINEMRDEIAATQMIKSSQTKLKH